MDLDLAAYRRRIGWQAEARADFATLSAVLDAHMRAIPFENLDVLLGRGISLALPALEDKLVHRLRGGYCFEHATLFAAVLERLGFAPIPHMARVVLATPRDLAARTHMFLEVPVGGARYVVDPGFGGLAPRVPLLLRDDGPGAEGRDGEETGDANWMQRDGRHWLMCARVDGATKECWVTALEHDNPVDFEMGNHYTATHPASAFRQRLLMRALTPSGSVSVMNREVTVRDGGREVKRVLADRRALRVLLAEDFGFDLAEAEALRVPAVPDWA